MKKPAKILLFLLVIAFLAADISCKQTCKGMKYHNRDVKKGLAH